MAGQKPPEPTGEELFSDAPSGEEARLHPILSNAEVRAAQDKARARVEAERKKAAMAAIEADETERLRTIEGLTTGIDLMDEIVDISIDLPPYATHISVNGLHGKHYWHGITYPVPRHVANSLRDTMFRMWRHEDQIEGRDLRQQYARKMDTVVNARTGAVANAPRRFDA